MKFTYIFNLKKNGRYFIIYRLDTAAYCKFICKVSKIILIDW